LGQPRWVAGTTKGASGEECKFTVRDGVPIVGEEVREKKGHGKKWSGRCLLNVRRGSRSGMVLTYGRSVPFLLKRKKKLGGLRGFWGRYGGELVGRRE